MPWPEVGAVDQRLRFVADRLSGEASMTELCEVYGISRRVGRSDLSRLLYDTVGDGVDVRLKHAGKRRFDLVIGADGLHSNVRRLAFGPQARFEAPLGYSVSTLEVHGYHRRDEDAYLIYGRPGWMVRRFTLKNDWTLFPFIFVADHGALPSMLDDQKAFLRKVYADGEWECPRILDELDRAESLYFDSVSQIRMDQWWRGRVALVGDAAFCVSLAAGQGSALGMVSAFVLAGELARARGRHEETFAAYDGRLRDYIIGKQEGARRFASALSPRIHLGMAFRNAVIRLFALPGLARLAIGREIADALPLPQYPWPSGATSAGPHDASAAQPTLTFRPPRKA